MRTESYEWQGAKRSRGGATASIRNAVRRAILFAPFGQPRNWAAYVVAQPLRGLTTRRPARLACSPMPGLCEAPFSVNRP